MNPILQIHPADSVAVALRALKAGETVAAGDRALTVRDGIPAGHKLALRPIRAGEEILKYGFPIGHAAADIRPGQHVHVHNLKTGLSGEQAYEWQPAHCPALPETAPRTFMGYPRKTGSAGIRNELWILPTVGCVNDIARALERDAQRFLSASVEHVYAFPHPYGCSQLGDDQDNTRRILADLATHPNAGGVLLLGLGCENSGVDEIRALMGDYDGSRVRFLVCQQTEDEHEAAMALLGELAERMASDRRVPCPLSGLTVGLKCGGSDGFSGITANPVIGGLADRVVAAGGSALLTEVPEMFGAETLLMNRCETPELFEKTVRLINDFKRYFESFGQPVFENPSPGNKAGGITTLEEKALGCTQKSGTSPVRGVLSYGEKAAVPGLSLLSAPGNDLVASTALAAAGAQLVLFSTGRGTPFACPVPTLKLASNPELAERKRNWIDFSAGELLNGKTLSELSDALLDEVLSVASGKQVRGEQAGFHDLAIFKNGVTL